MSAPSAWSKDYSNRQKALGDRGEGVTAIGRQPPGNGLGGHSNWLTAPR